MNNLKLLQLLQLTDSALPTGALAHSFGLEMLAVEEVITAGNLAVFLSDYLEEAGQLEAYFCRQAYRLAEVLPDALLFTNGWQVLNNLISAFKPGREARQASLSLGRRFARLVWQLKKIPGLENIISPPVPGRATLGARAGAGPGSHYCAAFGLVGGLLAIEEDTVVLAYLQQGVTALISACQRLMPLGQVQAAAINWSLNPSLLKATLNSRADQPGSAKPPSSFMPLMELGSMRHPALRTRLFIS